MAGMRAPETGGAQASSFGMREARHARIGRSGMPARNLCFASDNVVGAHLVVAEAVMRANAGAEAAYGGDDATLRVTRMLGNLFGREVAVQLVATGTGANALALASVTPPWGAVLTHIESHVSDDECGAPEFFSHGAKIVGLEGTGCKLDPATVDERLTRMPRGVLRQVQPAVLSITQATECGLVYSPAEIAALAEVCRRHRILLHMDGARFANAVAGAGVSAAAMTVEAGVDLMSFGFTKNGAFAAEAVVFFDPAKAGELAWRTKRGGHVLSKNRFVAVQVEALLRDDLWLANATHANAMARRLAAGLTAKGLKLGWAVEANEVFPLIPRETAARIEQAGFALRDWSPLALPESVTVPADHRLVRLVCSFATKAEDVEELIAAVG
jgi:threonine aldolase